MDHKMNGYTRSSNACIEIIEQPAPKALRFRYECEGRSAGSIPGKHSTPDNRTYPTIRVVGYEGNEDIVIVVSCVTKNPPHLAHPHNLVGKDCREGVCSINLDKDSKTAVFSNLGIQCVKKRDIEGALTLRETKRVDPFGRGFEHKNNPSSIDLNCVRLCFQAIVKSSKPVRLGEVVSDPIYDKKAMSDLLITKLSHTSGPARGGTEMILLCEKINKDDIQVRFFDEMEGREWEGFAKKISVHKQVAVCFETPPYLNPEIRDKVQVYVQLYRPSDRAISEPREFHYTASGHLFTTSRKRPRNNEEFVPIPPKVKSQSPFHDSILDTSLEKILDLMDAIQSSQSPQAGTSSNQGQIADQLPGGLYDIQLSPSFSVKIEPQSLPPSPYQDPTVCSPSVTPIPNDPNQATYMSPMPGTSSSIPRFDTTWRQPSTSPLPSYPNPNAFLVSPRQHDQPQAVSIPVPDQSPSPVPLGRSWTSNSPCASYQNPNVYLQSVNVVATEQPRIGSTFVTNTSSLQQSITQTEYSNTRENTASTMPLEQRLILEQIQETERRLFSTYINASSEATEPLASYGSTTNPINNEENPTNVEMTSIERIVDTNDLVGTSAINANNAVAGTGNEDQRLCDDFISSMNISNSFTRLVDENFK